MSKYRQHYFVCINQRPPFAKVSCGPQNGNQIYAALKDEVEKRGLKGEIKVTGSTCLGPCEEGPTIVVYPEGIWYKGVTEADVNEIVENHILKNKPVERLLYHHAE